MALKRARSPSPPFRLNDDILPSPVYQMGNYKEIYAFLCSKVKEQNTGMYTTAEKLQYIRDGHASLTGPSNVFKLVYTGTSGCGKTETLRWIRYALGMDPGYEHDNQYIEINNGFEYGDTRSISADRELLIERLNSAVNCYESRDGTRTYPHFILVSLDALDKLPSEFISSLTDLLRNGSFITSSRSTSFRLPKETTLVIVSTCTYGEEYISQMTYRLDSDAVPYVSRAMFDSGISEAAVRMMGDIIVIYPLKTETLRSIMMERLQQYVSESSICKQFGEISCADDVKERLIDKVMNLTEPGSGGIRQGLAKLLENIGDFFGKALQELMNNEMMMDKAKKSLVFKLREIDMKKFDETIEEECKEFLREIMHSLMHDPRNGPSFESHRLKQDNVNALSMYAEESHITSYELHNNLSMANQQNNLFNQCGFNFSPIHVARLKEENLELKDTLDKVDTLVQKNNNDGSTFYKKVKGIVTESKKNLHRYGGVDMLMEDGLIYNTNSRVHEVYTDEESEEEDEAQYQPLAITLPAISSSSSTSEEEEELEVPVTIHMVRRAKYRNFKPKRNCTKLLDSDIDEDSEEDNQRVINYHLESDRRLKKTLMKPYKHTTRKCVGPCQMTLPATSFNPTLYKGRITVIHFKKVCNSCKKKSQRTK